MSSLCNIFFCIYNFQFSDKLSFSLTHPRDTMRTSPALARVPPSHRPTKKAHDVYQRWEEDGPRSCFSELSIHRFFSPLFGYFCTFNAERWKNKPSKIGRMRTRKSSDGLGCIPVQSRKKLRAKWREKLLTAREETI